MKNKKVKCRNREGMTSFGANSLQHPLLMELVDHGFAV